MSDDRTTLKCGCGKTFQAWPSTIAAAAAAGRIPTCRECYTKSRRAMAPSHKRGGRSAKFGERLWKCAECGREYWERTSHLSRVARVRCVACGSLAVDLVSDDAKSQQIARNVASVVKPKNLAIGNASQSFGHKKVT